MVCSHMIDVLHPNDSNFNHHTNGSTRSHQVPNTEESESDTQEAEEEAWLASIAGLDTEVQLPQNRALVLDVAQLRQGATQQKQAAF